MSDAQEVIAFRPYSEGTEEITKAIEKATKDKNVVDMDAMVASMQAESQTLVLAKPSATGCTSSDQPLVPLQGTAELAQSMLAQGPLAISCYVAQPQVPPAGLFSLMNVPDRQALHMAAIDLISKRFRERMAGSIAAMPVDRDRLQELVPPDSLEAATAAFVKTALGEDTQEVEQ